MPSNGMATIVDERSGATRDSALRAGPRPGGSATIRTVQVFGTQHIAALGELPTASGGSPDVMGNFWSLGAAIVIR